MTARTLQARRANAAVTGFISEHLTGLRVIRAFGRTQATTDALCRLADRQADAELATTALNALLQPVYAILTVSGVVALLWLGGDRVSTGALTIGALVAFLQLFIPGPPVTTPPAATPAGPVLLRLRHVDFAYPGTTDHALRDCWPPAASTRGSTGPSSGSSLLRRESTVAHDQFEPSAATDTRGPRRHRRAGLVVAPDAWARGFRQSTDMAPRWLKLEMFVQVRPANPPSPQARTARRCFR